MCKSGEISHADLTHTFLCSDSAEEGETVAEIILKGMYTQSVDVKGRMAFPAKLREAVGENLILTRGVGGCIFVYSPETFDIVSKKLDSLPMSKGLTLKRVFMANAADVETDKQGRALIPARLRESAGIEGEAVVIGVSDHCEIWSPERWHKLDESISEEELLAALEGAEI